MRTLLKTFGRMFRRHATRLISIMLMVLVSVGFTAGIGMSTDKMIYSLSDYYFAENVSDVILMNTEGAFSAESVAALGERYGEENVLLGGMLEFEVKEPSCTPTSRTRGSGSCRQRSAIMSIVMVEGGMTSIFRRSRSRSSS